MFVQPRPEASSLGTRQMEAQEGQKVQETSSCSGRLLRLCHSPRVGIYTVVGTRCSCLGLFQGSVVAYVGLNARVGS